MYIKVGVKFNFFVILRHTYVYEDTKTLFQNLNFSSHFEFPNRPRHHLSITPKFCVSHGSMANAMMVVK